MGNKINFLKFVYLTKHRWRHEFSCQVFAVICITICLAMQSCDLDKGR